MGERGRNKEIECVQSKRARAKGLLASVLPSHSLNILVLEVNRSISKESKTDVLFNVATKKEHGILLEILILIVITYIINNLMIAQCQKCIYQRNDLPIKASCKHCVIIEMH